MFTGKVIIEKVLVLLESTPSLLADSLNCSGITVPVPNVKKSQVALFQQRRPKASTF